MITKILHESEKALKWFKNQPLKNKIHIAAITFIILLALLTGGKYKITASDHNEAKTAASENAEAEKTDKKAETDKSADASVETSPDGTTADQTDSARESQLYDLETELEPWIADSEGIWSIYVKDLNTGEALSINNQSMYAASLIKLFVMEDSFREMDTLVSNICINRGMDEVSGRKEVLNTIFYMITDSDNECYNELVRLHSSKCSFTQGCLAINESIQREGYPDTGIYHTLVPSDSPYESTESTKNHTSVEDCGALLESIYNNTCVSEEASSDMLNLLLQQENLYKIPAGLPSGIRVANKTGETDSTQHDAAIIYGSKTDYILCVMSSELDEPNDAVTTIQNISSTVYEFLNGI